MKKSTLKEIIREVINESGPDNFPEDIKKGTMIRNWQTKEVGKFIKYDKNYVIVSVKGKTKKFSVGTIEPVR